MLLFDYSVIDLLIDLSVEVELGFSFVVCNEEAKADVSLF